MNYNPQNYYGTATRNQYYGGYQPPMYDPNMYQNIQQPTPVVQPQQSTSSIVNYDFVGNFVRTYDEVKNYPLNCEKPVLLLDLANERLYIKQMDQKGNPIISGFNVAELKEENVSSPISQTTDNSWKKEMEELRRKIENLETQINNSITNNSKSQYTNNKK